MCCFLTCEWSRRNSKGNVISVDCARVDRWQLFLCHCFSATAVIMIKSWISSFFLLIELSDVAHELVIHHLKFVGLQSLSWELTSQLFLMFIFSLFVILHPRMEWHSLCFSFYLWVGIIDVVFNFFAERLTWCLIFSQLFWWAIIVSGIDVGRQPITSEQLSTIATEVVALSLLFASCWDNYEHWSILGIFLGGVVYIDYGLLIAVIVSWIHQL